MDGNGGGASDGAIEIVAMENGPNRISGPVRLVGADNKEIQHAAVFALCRCGQSANKPFCDGTHKKIGFQAPGARLTAAPGQGG